MFLTKDLVAQYMGECKARGLKASTLLQSQWALDRLAYHCPELPCSTLNLLPVFDQPGLGLESRRDLRKCLRTFFGWTGERHGIPDPCKSLGRFPKSGLLPRVLTTDELAKLLTAAEHPRDRALILIVLDCGLRLSEVAGLRKWGIRDGWLVVDGKSGVRQVPVSRELGALLRNLGRGEHVWMGRQGPLTRHGVQQAFKRMFARAGLGGRKAGPHAIRHTFATLYLRSGGGLHHLQRILGHRSIETTMIYVHLAGTDVAADHALHSPVHTMALMS